MPSPSINTTPTWQNIWGYNENMFQKISLILIWSEDFRKLAEWYKDVFDLKVTDELNHPQDTGILLAFPQGDCRIWIGQHSEIKGQSKDPLRIMFNINVDSIDKAYDHLLAKKVKIVATPFKAPTFDKYFVTFSDLDGNTGQLIGPR